MTRKRKKGRRKEDEERPREEKGSGGKDDSDAQLKQSPYMFFSKSKYAWYVTIML